MKCDCCGDAIDRAPWVFLWMWALFCVDCGCDLAALYTEMVQDAGFAPWRRA